MFSFNKKIDPDLKAIMVLYPNKNHRILIKYVKFPDFIIKKVLSYKGIIVRKIESCNIICVKLNSKSIERLLEYPEIQYICLDQYLFLCGMSVLSANKIRLHTNTSLSGKNIGIGVVDTGVYPHKDLTLPQNRIHTFVDLINSFTNPYDDNGHGTSICGIIAGNGESSNGIYKGIATNSELHVFKAFDKLGKGLVSDVLFSIEELILLKDQYNIRILCLPFELLTFNNFIYTLFDNIFTKAVNSSIIPVLPSGSNRDEASTITGPALSPHCITVAGLDTSGETKSYAYSSCGDVKKDIKPNFSADCVDIISLNSNISFVPEKNNIKMYAPKLDSSYKSFSGTSLSAAFISGVCALLYEKKPDLTFDDVISMLKLNADVMDIETYKQGYGKINLTKLLK